MMPIRRKHERPETGINLTSASFVEIAFLSPPHVSKFCHSNGGRGGGSGGEAESDHTLHSTHPILAFPSAGGGAVGWPIVKRHTGTCLAE